MHSSNYTHGFGWISWAPGHKSHSLHKYSCKLQIHIFKKRKKKTTTVGVRLFSARRSCTLSVSRCRLTPLCARPSDTKTLTSIHCNVRWVSESTLNFRATCSSKTNPQQNNNTPSFTLKEDFKEVKCPSGPIRFIGTVTDLRSALNTKLTLKHCSFPKEASLNSVISFPFG